MTVAPMDISREQRTELLASADPDSIQRLAEIALSYAFVSESIYMRRKKKSSQKVTFLHNINVCYKHYPYASSFLLSTRYVFGKTMIG